MSHAESIYSPCSCCCLTSSKKNKEADQRRKCLVGKFVIGSCVLCLQEWKSVKNKESRLLITPGVQNKGKTKVRRYFPPMNLLLLLQYERWSLVLFSQASVTPVLPPHITKTFTHFTSVTSPFPPACLSSRCFHWPSLPSGKPTSCSTASPRAPCSGNDCSHPSACTLGARPPGDLKNTHAFLLPDALLTCPIAPGVFTVRSVFRLV